MNELITGIQRRRGLEIGFHPDACLGGISAVLLSISYASLLVTVKYYGREVVFMHYYHHFQEDPVPVKQFVRPAL